MHRRTTVVVDAHPLSDASAFRGIGSYARNVLAGLGGDPSLSVVLVGPSSVPSVPGTTRRRTRRWAPPRWQAAEHELRLPFDLRGTPGDVLFTLGSHPPRRSPIPVVAALHDALPLAHPSPTFAVERRRWERAAPRWRAAEIVVASSHHAAEQGVALLGLRPERVRVVHLGVGDEYRPRGVAAADPPFVLYVGEYGPHKGFAEAFAVIARLAALGLPHRLAMAGRIAPWYAGEIERLRAASPAPERIDLLGFVEDLPDLYTRASALIVTSRHEGFGFPALEAMASGTPVVAFANSATVEVVGDGGVLVADGEVEAMADALRPLLVDEAAADRARRAGLARAARFPWSATVAGVAQVLRSVGAGRHHEQPSADAGDPADQRGGSPDA